MKEENQNIQQDSVNPDENPNHNDGAKSEKAEEEITNLKNKLLYAHADLDNMRKRLEKERAELTKYGALTIAKLLCPVADNLHRALSAIPNIMHENKECETFLHGLKMVNDQFYKALADCSITIIHPNPGDSFSYHDHQAVDEIPSKDLPPGSIASVIQRGYRLHDRLIRPAMVLIAAQNTTKNDESIDNNT